RTGGRIFCRGPGATLLGSDRRGGGHRARAGRWAWYRGGCPKARPTPPFEKAFPGPCFPPPPSIIWGMFFTRTVPVRPRDHSNSPAKATQLKSPHDLTQPFWLAVKCLISLRRKLRT